jgi:deoxyribodipyrimidine photolyase-related protein
MSAFLEALRQRTTAPPGARRWLFVPYDQLSDQIGPLSREPPDKLGIVLVECPQKASRRPYHQQKLALILANLRHFALEQAARGVAVRHIAAAPRASYADALRPVVAQVGPLRMMRPAERELRAELAPLVASGDILEIPHEGWLTPPGALGKIPGPPWRMDAFYREARRSTGLLMDRRGKPEGGRFSFDGENRLPWPGDPPAPEPPRFHPDPITHEVLDLVRSRYGAHPGTLDDATLPATAADAERLWRWGIEACLPWFGPFEDAMSTRSTGIFHTRISPLLHLHRILPSRVVREVASLPIPLASREGFVRQVLGWREFMRHVHEATDGLRQLPSGPAPLWRGREEAGAAPSFLGAMQPLPGAFWGRSRSGLACLDQVVQDVWSEGWSHHITRLMVLSNIATLLDVSPRELTDWFWVAYIDAFDWVVEPNVLGMGTFGVGDLFTTKPYVSGAAYLARMSDYCEKCAFDPRKNCPITPLYWAFLERHEPQLRNNDRMKLPLASMRKRTEAQRAADRAVFKRTQEALAEGRRLSPHGDPTHG